jgi:hypothetical protein
MLDRLRRWVLGENRMRRHAILAGIRQEMDAHPVARRDFEPYHRELPPAVEQMEPARKISLWKVQI